MHPLDISRLERHARDLAAAATRLTALQASLTSGARALRWRSPAAQAFAGALHSALGQLGTAAARLHDLAGSVGQHGARAATHAGELRSAAAEPGAIAGAAVRFERSAAVDLARHLMRPR